MRNRTFKSAILLLSGGIDSTTVLHRLTRNGYYVHCLIFNYGQSLKKEIDFAVNNALDLGHKPIIIKADLRWLDGNCTLISKNKIELDRTEEQINAKTPSSYVPFRNGVFFSYAVAYAETHGIKDIYAGCNGLQSGNYWDDTITFVREFNKAIRAGTQPGQNINIHVPYALVEKSLIVAEGLYMGIDYEKTTWSCYKNGAKHCGRCDSCYQRKKALKDAIEIQRKNGNGQDIQD